MIFSAKFKFDVLKSNILELKKIYARISGPVDK